MRLRRLKGLPIRCHSTVWSSVRFGVATCTASAFARARDWQSSWAVLRHSARGMDWSLVSLHPALDLARRPWSVTAHAHPCPPIPSLVAHLVTGGRCDFPDLPIARGRHAG